jgi:hypothetical protein
MEPARIDYLASLIRALRYFLIPCRAALIFFSNSTAGVLDSSL